MLRPRCRPLKASQDCAASGMAQLRSAKSTRYMIAILFDNAAQRAETAQDPRRLNSHSSM